MAESLRREVSKWLSQGWIEKFRGEGGTGKKDKRCFLCIMSPIKLIHLLQTSTCKR